jgi:hypothetical protein
MPNAEGKATPGEVRAYFDGGINPITGQPAAKVTASEIMALKKTPGTTEALPDYDQLAFGIGNGTLTY